MEKKKFQISKPEVREHVWYCEPADELFTLPMRPAEGFEAFAHDIEVEGQVLIMGATYIGEL